MMRCKFAEASHADHVAYFNFHGDLLLRERAALVSALERWAGVCKSCGTFENSNMTAAQYVSNLLESADNPLAEEVVDYIGAG